MTTVNSKWESSRSKTTEDINMTEEQLIEFTAKLGGADLGFIIGTWMNINEADKMNIKMTEPGNEDTDEFVITRIEAHKSNDDAFRDFDKMFKEIFG